MKNKKSASESISDTKKFTEDREMRDDFRKCIEDTTGMSAEEIAQTPVNELLDRKPKPTLLQRLFGWLAEAIIGTAHAIAEIPTFPVCVQHDIDGGLVQTDPISRSE